MRLVPLLAVGCVACGFPAPEDVPDDAADFSLMLASARVRALEGTSVTIGVTIARNAFPDAVTVTVGGLPDGTTADPLIVTADTGTLTLHVAVGATQGDATLTVTAAGGDRSHDLPLSLLEMGPPGTLDRSFSSGGTLSMSPTGLAYAMVIQPDAKIVIAGQVSRTTTDLLVARYLPSGELDPGFSGGVVVSGSTLNDAATALALQPDGKIVVVGTVSSGAAGDGHGLVARFHTDGSLDDGFGTGGRLQLELNAPGAPQFTALNAVAVQPDGGIVVAGTTLATATEFDAVVARLAPTGTLDNSFGTTGGRTMVQLGTGNDRFLALALQPDGRIVAAGTGAQGAAHIAGFARFTTSGRPDSAFDSDGKVSIDIGDTATTANDFAFGASIALQPDGKIVVAGGASSGSGLDACLVRLNGTDGSPDGDFGSNGVKVVSVAPGHFDRVIGLALQPDGKLVIGGSVPTGTLTSSHAQDFDGVVARFGASGVLDLGFGAGGVVTRELSDDVDAVDEIRGIALDPDGRIITAGFFNPATGPGKVLLARFWP